VMKKTLSVEELKAKEEMTKINAIISEKIRETQIAKEEMVNWEYQNA
jgi:hypothetical protein